MELTRRIPRSAEIGGHLLEVPGREVAPVVGIEDPGDAADLPAGSALAPDRLVQGQGRLDRRGAAEEQRVARRGTAVVVEDDRQPGLPGTPLPVFQHDVEFRVIGLPDGVGTGRLVAVDQVEGVGIGVRPLVGQGPQGRVQGADQVIDGVVARRRLPELRGEVDGLAMDGRRR
jgi:hypothetical protein